MNNKFLKNTSWLLVGNIIHMLLQFVVGTLSARYLGPSDYGVVNYVASYTAFFSSLCGLGLNTVIIGEIVNHREQENTIINTCINLRLAVSIISAVIMVALIGMIEQSNKEFIIVAALQAIQLPFAAFNTINYWYQANLQSKYAVIAMNASYVVTSAYRITLLATGQSVRWFAFANSLDIILLSILYYCGYRKRRNKIMKTQSWSFDVAKRILRGCVPFIVAEIMIQIYQQTDKIMLKLMLGSTEAVGLYTAVTTICTIIGFVPRAILDSARPTIMSLKGKDEEHYTLRMRQLFAVLIWGNMLYAIFVTIFAKWIVCFLYGSQYLSGVSALRIAVWFTAFSYLGSARSTWLICESQNKFAMTFSVMGALTNIVLNYLMIPAMGVNGAALATLLTQGLNNLIYPCVFKETRGDFKLAIEALCLRKLNLRNERLVLLQGLKKGSVGK